MGLQSCDGGLVVRVYCEMGLPHSNGFVQVMVREDEVQERGVMMCAEGGPEV